MSASWRKVTARFDALQARERKLVALAILGGSLLIGYAFLIGPALERASLAERNSADARAQLANLQAQVIELQAPQRNPDVAARVELDSLKLKLATIASRLDVMESSLVPPQRMAGLLEEMIGRRNGVRLLSLKTLPASPVLERKSAGEDKQKTANRTDSPTDGLFKHGVEIKLEGSYLDLLAYLERLEQAQLKLLWSNVALSTDRYPKLVLTLTVYSLSLDKTWLIV